MKILLISSNTATSPYPLYPLGLSMIASALKGAGHEIRQFDYLERDSSLDALENTVREFQPALVGISMRNIDNVNYLSEIRYIDDVRAIVAKLRELTEAKVLLGGAGFSLIPEEILKEVGADYGIAGEGEALVVDFVANAERGVYPEHVVIGPEQRLQGEQIPSALYDSGLMEFYLKKGNIASVQSKRGCAYSCVYCTYPLLEGHAIRPRSAERVVDDIIRLRDEHDVKYIFFIDSVFNDREGDRFAEPLAEERRDPLTRHHEWRSRIGPDQPIRRGRVVGTLGEDEELQDEPTQSRGRVDHQRIGEELLQVGPHILDLGALR